MSKLNNRLLRKPDVQKVSILLLKALDTVLDLSGTRETSPVSGEVSCMPVSLDNDTSLISLEQYEQGCKDFLKLAKEFYSAARLPRLCHGSQFGLASYLLSTADSIRDVIKLFGIEAGTLGFMPFRCEVNMIEASLSIPTTDLENAKPLSGLAVHFLIASWCRLFECCFETYSRKSYIVVEGTSQFIEPLQEAFQHGFTFKQITTDYLVIRADKQNANSTLPGSNQRLHSLFKKEIEELRHIFESPEDLAPKIHAFLNERPTYQGINGAVVAEKFAMSERTLARKLDKEGTSFKKIFKGVRSVRSISMLMEGRAIEDVAQSLGFSDRSSFERAFKTWQGLTPAFIQSKYAALASERDISYFIEPKSIPALPKIAVQLLEALQNSETPIDDIANIVATDAALSAKVLWIANSSLYGNLKIKTVKHAILSVFGTEHLKALVISLLATEVFPIDNEIFDFNEYWSCSLIAARVTECLFNKEVDKDSLSNYYFATLLHNIGDIFLCYCMPNKYKQISEETRELISWRRLNSIQSLRLNINASECSAVLSAMWSLPESIRSSLNAFVNGNTSGSHLDVLKLIIELSHLCYRQNFDEKSKKQNIKRFLLQIDQRFESALPRTIEDELSEILDEHSQVHI